MEHPRASPPPHYCLSSNGGWILAVPGGGWSALVVSGENGRVTEPATTDLDPQIAALLKRNEAGLVPAIIQQQTTGEVLMLGWMDDHALHRTLTEGRTTFWSRSRQTYWVKGEQSGNAQWVRQVRLDCDGDTLLVTVDAEGPACHTGDRTCFDARPLTVTSPATNSPATIRSGTNRSTGEDADLRRPADSEHGVR